MGLKSIAIRFGDNTKLFAAVLATIQLGLLILAGMRQASHFYISCAHAAELLSL